MEEEDKKEENKEEILAVIDTISIDRMVWRSLFLIILVSSIIIVILDLLGVL